MQIVELSISDPLIQRIFGRPHLALDRFGEPDIVDEHAEFEVPVFCAP